MDSSVRTFDISLADGRTLHAYDRMPAGGQVRATVYWQHGSPNIGAPPAPLFQQADRLGVRFLGHDRPGYGGSTLTPPGRLISDVVADLTAVCDAAAVSDVGLFGHSGGGPHVLACAALAPERVTAVVAASSPAPYTTIGFDYFAGVGDPGPTRAALQGREARAAYVEPDDAQPPFTAADWAALQGDWSWVLEVVRPALEGDGPEALIDDDVALVSDWGCDLNAIAVPVLLLHGGDDELVPPSHSRRLDRLIRGAELRIADGEGHVSVLAQAPAALDWLAARIS